jgi:hypothetical protein
VRNLDNPKFHLKSEVAFTKENENGRSVETDSCTCVELAFRKCLLVIGLQAKVLGAGSRALKTRNPPERRKTFLMR